MKSNYTLYIIAIAALLSACGSKPSNPTSHPDNGETETYDDTAHIIERGTSAMDSLVSEEVSNKCAILYVSVNELQDMLSSVKSPDALIPAKKKYMSSMPKLKNEVATLSGEEQTVLNRVLATTENKFDEVCKQYELPASGVIDNLKNLINRLDQIKTKQEFQRFMDIRIGMLRKLDDIHLCVQSNSNRIKEVKSLAQTLKNKFETKKHDFELD